MINNLLFQVQAQIKVVLEHWRQIAGVGAERKKAEAERIRKEEENRGQIPITDEDFERIPDVVENYDEITVDEGKRNDVNIVYSKTYEDGTTVFVEEKRDKRKELAAVTMWKKKGLSLTDANRENTTPIPDLSETISAGKDITNSDSVQENGGKNEEKAGISHKAAENATSEEATESGLQEGNRVSADRTPRQQKSEGAEPVTKEEAVLRDALAEMMQKSGLDVVGSEEGQRVLDEANGTAKLQASLNGLRKASNFILDVLRGNAKQKSSKLEISQRANNLAERAIGHAIKSHTINANEIKHAKNRHGLNGTANDGYSIPLRDEDIALLPYIMVCPDRVSKGTVASNGAESVRYEKDLSNGIVIVVEREGRFDVEDMENITMWAKKRSATNVTVDTRSSHSTSETIVISETDAAKIRKDAENAIANDEKIRKHRVFHGSGADFDAFDHSHMGIRFFRTKDGEAYGFTVGGKIYFDPRIAKSETLVHEYAHLWATALKSGNPEEWKNVVELMKGTSVWEEVRKSYPELKTDDEIADEVIAQYSGRRGAERLHAEQQKILEGNSGIFEKAEAISALQRVKRALAKFWRGVCDFLHIHYTSAEEVADRVMKDLLDGVDPRKFGKTDGTLRHQFVGEKGAKAEDVSREDQIFLFGGGSKSRSENKEDYQTFKGEEAAHKLKSLLGERTDRKLPSKISTLAEFKEVFANPIRSAFNEVVKVKDEVFNKILRKSRLDISGTVLPTLQDADFGHHDKDGSILYIKRYKNAENEHIYNVAVVNKYGELEDYISSVHIKNDNNLLNKIEKGAELLLPNERNTYGQEAQSNSTPTAKIGTNSETTKLSGENLSEDKDLKFRTVYGGNRFTFPIL